MNPQLDDITESINLWLFVRGYEDATDQFALLEELSSLDVLDLSVHLEDQFEIDGLMAAAKLADLQTVSSLAIYVAKQVGR